MRDHVPAAFAQRLRINPCPCLRPALGQCCQVGHGLRLADQRAAHPACAHGSLPILQRLSSDRNNWIGEPDAKAAYDDHLAAAQALEDWEAAVGAGGVQALSAAPVIGDELRDTLVAVSAAIAERDDRAAQKMICEILAASTTPPAEQQAQPGAVYAELPQPDSWFHFTAQFWENKMRDFADRTHALRMQAAPKAAPAWADQAVIEYRYAGGTHWCPLGPAERMKPDFQGVYRLQGGVFPVEQAAPKAAPGEPSDYQIRAITTAYEQGVGKGHQAYKSGKEIANPYDSTYRCDLAWQYGYGEGKEQAQRGVKPDRQCLALYTAPQPAPAPVSESIDQLARKLEIIGVVGVVDGHDVVRRESVLEIARRAALAAQGGK